jgi:lipid II:glycine glycyltransferase (peptidoglycan interpeptide bridge formation enzyme)
MQAFDGPGAEWNALVARLPRAHLLQTWDWAQVKAAYGWKPMPFLWHAAGADQAPTAAAMLLRRPVLNRGFAARLCLMYVPKGPLFDMANGGLQAMVLNDLQVYARKHGAILLKIDPDVQLGWGVPGQADARDNAAGIGLRSDLQRRGWQDSAEQVQFRNTVIVDLTVSEDELLVHMKQKTRYNVRLAQKKGVQIRAGAQDDLTMLYRMYAETSVRDGFVIRPEAYYRTVWESFMKPTIERDQPFAEPLIAEVDGTGVAAIFVFYFARRAYYLYGMSLESHRDKMPNYLLQWEAMRRAKARGCTSYDLWGAPDEFNEQDSMWGVYRFKEGLGGEVVRTLGAWDYPASPIWYKAFTQIVPRVLAITRIQGRARTERSLD